MKVSPLPELLEEGTRLLGTWSGEKPELIPLGLPTVDKKIGGLDPGSCGILGAPTGVGKSSIVLDSSLSSPVPVGIVSLEDPIGVLTSRYVSRLTGIDSKLLRQNNLSATQRDHIRRTLDAATGLGNVTITTPIAAPLRDVVEAVRLLAEHGCRMIWVDYLHKIGGLREDRRSEIRECFRQIQEMCAKHSVAGMVVCQLRRYDVRERPIPRIDDLKESGDLENEARLVILAWRDAMVDESNVVTCEVVKSTNSESGFRWHYMRNENGVLLPLPSHEYRELKEQKSLRLLRESGGF